MRRDLLISDAFSGEDTGLLMVVARFRDANQSRCKLRPTRNWVVKNFHWPLEFPKCYAPGRVDALVCNPPFMGGQKITGNFVRPTGLFGGTSGRR